MNVGAHVQRRFRTSFKMFQFIWNHEEADDAMLSRKGVILYKCHYVGCRFQRSTAGVRESAFTVANVPLKKIWEQSDVYLHE